MADNKFVRIGTRGLKIAKLNDDGLVVGEPLSLPGTTEADITITSENSTINADDGPYMTLSSGISKVTLKLSNYFLTPEAKRMILGTKYAMGMEVYGDDAMPNHVAIMFESVNKLLYKLKSKVTFWASRVPDFSFAILPVPFLIVKGKLGPAVVWVFGIEDVSFVNVSAFM